MTANAMDLAATLRFGDHVNGLTADGHPFAGYLCADPEQGRTAGGYDATILRLASHPVPGRGSVWAICRDALINVLPVEPSVAGLLAVNLHVLRLDADQRDRVAKWCAGNGHPITEETR